MAFFPEKLKNKLDTAWARALRDAVQKHGRAVKIQSLSNWTDNFTKLRQEKGPDLVGKVLVWYIENMGKEFVPQAYTAGVFRVKFDQIKQAMERTEDIPEEIDQRSKNLAEWIANDHPFPVEILAKLPQIAKKTKERWDRFCEVITTEYANDARGSDFILHILNLYGFCFVEDWILGLSKRLGHTPHYTGPIMSLAWKLDSIWFRESFWRQWSLEWSGDPLTFDDLLDRLIKEQKS